MGEGVQKLTEKPVGARDRIKAAELLESAQKINARVLDIHTWKPLDEALILKAAAETGCIVTAENHQVSCGLGSAVANLLSQKCPVPLERIGIQRTASDRSARSRS